MQQDDMTISSAEGAASATKSADNIRPPRGLHSDIICTQVGVCEDVIVMMTALEEMIDMTRQYFPQVKADTLEDRVEQMRKLASLALRQLIGAHDRMVRVVGEQYA